LPLQFSVLFSVDDVAAFHGGAIVTAKKKR